MKRVVLSVLAVLFFVSLVFAANGSAEDGFNLLQFLGGGFIGLVGGIFGGLFPGLKKLKNFKKAIDELVDLIIVVKKQVGDPLVKKELTEFLQAVAKVLQDYGMADKANRVRNFI